MYHEPEPMREIHEIREQMYEAMKSMSAKEKINYIRKSALEAEKKYGFHLRKAAHAHK
jgi:hypothetical protein